MYFGERYLVPRIGRWLSPDPLAIHAVGGGEALNSYHYVAGNLLQASDPLGLGPEDRVEAREFASRGEAAPPESPAGVEVGENLPPTIVNERADAARGQLMADIEGMARSNALRLDTAARHDPALVALTTSEMLAQDNLRWQGGHITPDFARLQGLADKLLTSQTAVAAYRAQLSSHGRVIAQQEAHIRIAGGLAGLQGAAAATSMGTRGWRHLMMEGPFARTRGLPNSEVRAWYAERARALDTSGPLTRETAARVHAARNALKAEARGMMADRAAAAELDQTQPIRPFEYYVERYTRQGFTGEALWKRIIQGGTTPNPEVNARHGVR